MQRQKLDTYHKQLMQDLREEFKAMPELPVSGLPATRICWNKYQNRLRHLMLHGNLKKFLRWDVILSSIKLDDVQWTEWSIAHIPGSTYLMGARATEHGLPEA